MIFRLLAVASVTAAAFMSSAMGQSWPNRAITLIVPSAAGGPTDVQGRIIADYLSKALGQPFVIENVTGAGGTTGLARAAAAPADGYTLVVGATGTLGSSVALYANLKYNPETDFTPIGLFSDVQSLVVARKNFPTNSVKEFVAYLKANGDKVNEAHAGIGSASHTTCTLLISLINPKINRVAYRGTAPALNDMVAGNVDFGCDAVGNSGPQILAGTVKGIGVGARKRAAMLPDLPTFAEGGMPEYTVFTWFALLGPKGMPKEATDKLVAALDGALEDAATRKRLIDIGNDIPEKNMRGPAALQKQIRADIDLWSRLLKEAGVQPQ